LAATEWRVLGSFANAVPCDLDLSSGLGSSRDGSVIVGIAKNGCSTAHAFRREESTGVEPAGRFEIPHGDRGRGVLASQHVELLFSYEHFS
jgi:hypothetical protein